MTDHQPEETKPFPEPDSTDIDAGATDQRIVFRNPSFKVQRDCLRYALPLSKLAKVPSNEGKRLSVAAVVVKHPDEILVRADGGETDLPSGPVKYGTDQTLLEAVVRVVREKVVIQVDAIRAHVSTLKHPGEDEAGVGDDSERKGKAKASEGHVQRAHGERRFVFITEVGPDTPAPEGWRWAPRQDYSDFKIALSEDGQGRTVLHSRQTVKIPPTRLVKPTSFKVASPLKAYLLPLKVFASLPPCKNKQLSAGAAILHPKQDRKILLVQRADTGYWEIPGRSADATRDETLLHTAARAVREGTGLKVRTFRGLAGSFERRIPASGSKGKGRPTVWKGYNFLVSVEGPANADDDQLQLQLDSKRYKAFKWVGSRADLVGMEVEGPIKEVIEPLLAALSGSKK